MVDNHSRLGAENTMHENTRTTGRGRIPLAVALVAGVLAVSSGASEDVADDEATGYAADWGPAIGTAIPEFETRDSQGTSRDFASLAGDRGLLLVISRSADW